MKRALRYNELDELAWEAEHGCTDYGDIDDEDEFDWYEEHVLGRGSNWHEDAPDEESVLDDETGPGIFGNELNHAQNAQNHCKAPEYCTCVSNGTVYGHGEKDEIERVVFNLLEPFKDYHFEFKFFEAK